MKQLTGIMLVIIFSTGFAQTPAWFEEPTPPRLFLGGDAGLFRISHSDFKEFYTDRWGPSYSATAGVRVYSYYYATFSFGQFNKDGKPNVYPTYTEEPAEPHWRENWYKIGVQMHPLRQEKWGSFYGFGFALYHIDEKDPVRIYSSDRGQGFYMDIGADYKVHETATLYLKISISSGGERDRSGFESRSIGGYRFALGLSVWPF
ncbi:MAG: hypothetical protein U5R06_14820 [candidate division KSB1 bacterium]|nr:hypothetical protein [candidate division KSB1 bacterium]